MHEVFDPPEKPTGCFPWLVVGLVVLVLAIWMTSLALLLPVTP